MIITTSALAAHANPNEPIGVHSMLYLNTPFTAQEAMFEEAAAVGASMVRLDLELSGVFTTRDGPPNWGWVNQYMRLAERFHLHVLADLLATPPYLAQCPTGIHLTTTDTCPPTDPTVWAHDAGLIAAHTRGVINDFEIINEPDGGWAFYGTPRQYAMILSASYEAIHAAAPNAEVVLGGLRDIQSHTWINQVLSTPRADALHRFDIANIHVRTPASQAAPTVADWRRYLAHERFRGPLWVTETGYPADPRWQTDPGYRDGPASQARWMATVIPAMLHAGAAMVFVTERDSLTGRYASEGILQSADPLTADPQYTRRPSYYTIRGLIHQQDLNNTSAQVPGTTMTPPGPGESAPHQFCIRATTGHNSGQVRALPCAARPEVHSTLNGPTARPPQGFPPE